MKNPKSAANRSFFIFAFGIAAWTSCKVFLIFFEKIFFVSPMLWGIEVTVLGFVCLAHFFPKGEMSFSFLVSLAPWAFLVAAVPFGAVISSVHLAPQGYLITTGGIFFPFFALIMGGYVAISLAVLWRKYTATKGMVHMQMRWLMLGAGIFIMAMLVSDVLLPLFHISRLTMIGPLFSLVLIGCCGYSIARYEFMDIRLVVKRGVSYGFSIAAVALIFFSIEFVVEKFFYTNDEVVDIIAAVVGALAFWRIKKFFDTLTDRIFFKQQYRFSDAVRRLGIALVATIDLDALFGAINESLGKTIKPASVTFFLIKDGAPKRFVGTAPMAVGVAIASGEQDLLAVFLGGGGNESVFAEQGITHFPRDAPPTAQVDFFEDARRLSVAAIIPLVFQGSPKAIVLVGPKRSGDILSPTDRELLEVLSQYGGMAVENALLYEAAKRHNEELERLVAERTERIRTMYHDQSKFLADLSHEFKTPLAILRMHLGVGAGSVSAEQRKAQYVMETTLDRLSRMVATLLDSARFNFSQASAPKQRVDLQSLLTDVCEDFEGIAKDRGVNLVVQGEQVSGAGDKDRLKEVFLNLLSNALNHTPAGGSVSFSARKIDGEAEIVIEDNGNGIPRKNLDHIFERFYRIDDGISSGTGIGLHLCRQIIEAHGGTIIAESDTGEGSRFIVRLPLFASIS
ncbi:MAG: ATP-binding protein [Minisyncoccia bacterium]